MRRAGKCAGHALQAAIAAVVLALQPAGAFAREVRLAHHYVQNSIQGQTGQSFADAVNAATDLKVRIFWSGALGGGREIAQLVGGGAIEMGVTVPAYTPALVPISGISSSFALYFDSIVGALDATRAVLDDPAAKAELEKANLEVLVVHTTAPYHLVCNKPVASMNDLKGLKVRTVNALSGRALSQLGIVPVTLVSSEIYGALQRGTVDCALYSYEFAIAQKLHEVAKYWSTLSFGAFTGAQLYANRDFMRSLPEDAARKVRAAGRGAEQAEVAKNEAAVEKAIQIAEAANVTLVPFDETEAFRKTMPDALDLWKEDVVKSSGVSERDASRIIGTVRRIAGRT